jgi:sarcosine oxidase subunit gamma
MADVSIAPLRECARWSLRMPAATAAKLAGVAGFGVSLEINRASQDGDRLLARLGPDEWLLCAPDGQAADEIEVLLAGEHHSLVDVGHRYAGYQVEGPQAAALLAAGCPLDLHPKAFGAGSATRTLLSKAEIVLWRLQEVTSYRVECARSYAPYLGAFLKESAREWR